MAGRQGSGDTDDESAATAVRPYRNVYVFRLDWLDGLVVGIEEYANPITFCRTFDVPMG
jgi:ketosteroid isomerase-like protein